MRNATTEVLGFCSGSQQMNSLLKQRVNKRGRAGATERDQNAQKEDRNYNRDHVPLFVVPEEHHEFSKEPGVLFKFVG